MATLKTKSWYVGNMQYCQNKKCPNGHNIEVSIFKGSGRCSDMCSKALGLDGKDANRG